MIQRLSALFLCLLVPLIVVGQLYEFKQDQAWGLIDRQGTVVLPATYDRIEASADRTYFYLYQSGKTGLYHRAGGMISRPVYEHVFPLRHGYYVLADSGQYGIMDTTGRLVSPPAFDRYQQEGSYFYTYRDQQAGLFHPVHGELIEAKYDTIYRFDSLRFAIREQGLLGLADTLGNVIEPPIYEEIAHFFEEWYTFRKGKYQGMKRLGDPEMTLPVAFTRMELFDHGGVHVQAAGKGINALYNFEGQPILDSIPVWLEAWHGDAYTYRSGRGLGLMSQDKRPLTKAIFERILNRHEAFFFVGRAGRWGVTNRSGEAVLPMEFRSLEVDSSKYIWAQAAQGLWGVYDDTGNVVMEPTFLQPGNFQYKVAVVAVEGQDTLTVKDSLIIRPRPRYGLINQFGEYLAEPIYDGIKVYPDMARLKRGEVIDQVGFDEEGRKHTRRKLIVASSSQAYDQRVKAQQLELAKASSQASATDSLGMLMRSQPPSPEWVKMEGKWGLRVEKQGGAEWLINPSFLAIERQPGDTYVLVSQEQRHFNRTELRYGLVDEADGTMILPVAFRKIFLEDLDHGSLFRVVDGDRYYNLYSLEGHSTIASPSRYWGFWFQYGQYNISRPPSYLGPIEDGVLRACFHGPQWSEGNSEEFVPAPEAEGIWGLLNPNGTFALAPVYAYLGEAVAGSRVYHYKREWGLLTKKDGTYFKVAKDFQQLIDPDPRSDALINEYEGHQLSVLDHQGKHLVSLPLDQRNPDYAGEKVAEVGIPRENLLAFRIRQKWGFMHTSGRVAITPEHSQVRNFSQGLAAFKSGRDWGFMDTTGQVVIDPKYREVRDFRGGLAPVKDDKGWTFIERDGTRTQRPFIDRLEPFVHGKAIAQELTSSRWGLVDTLGQWVVAPEYDEITPMGDHYRLRSGRSYGLIDQQLSEILPVEYEFLSDIREGKVALRQGRRYGFADLNGTLSIAPAYEAVMSFQDSLAAVKQDRRWGFVDHQGSLVIPAMYEKVLSFEAGVAAVSHRVGPDRLFRWGVIDHSGEQVLPFVYLEIAITPTGLIRCKTLDGQWRYYDRYGIPLKQGAVEEPSPYQHGLATVRDGGRTYVLDESGQRITDPGYDRILQWTPPYIMAESLRRQGLIDRKGQEVLPANYEHIQYVDGIFQVVNHGKVGYVDQTGQWIWPLRE